MATTEPPAVTYRFVVHATIDGHTAPLSIEGASLNEVRRAVRLLDANGMLSSTPAAPPSTDEAPRCPVHTRPMKASQHGGCYCTAKNGDGEYCKERIK